MWLARGGDPPRVEGRSGDEGGGRDGEPRRAQVIGRWARQRRKRIILVICNRGIYVSVPGDPGERELS